jgi:DNA repair exonuclease SbcCD ATPase subunit
MASGEFKSALSGANDMEKFKELCKLPYKHQAVWYLNAFWSEGGEAQAEILWDFTQRAGKIDNAGPDGFELDEMEAHRFLEQLHDTHTVLEMRSKLRATGAIAQNERPKTVPLTHYLLFKYSTDWHKLVNASQGDNSGEIAEAQAKLRAVQEAFDAADARAKESSAAAAEAKSRADAAAAKEAEAREAEAPFKAACEELEAARSAVKAQEDAYNKKTEELKAASESGGVVSRNKAKVQLDAHMAEDPLPLRKAKLTLAAAQKKADKARAPFQEKTEAAETARAAADAAQAEANAAAAAAQAAVDDCATKMAEAEAYLEEVKSKPGCAMGAMWWIDRELHEKKKYMPMRKGGIAK